MWSLKKTVLIFLSISCFCVAETDGKKKKSKEATGPVARELQRRQKLRVYMQKKGVDNNEYFTRIYKPTEIGCQDSIKVAKKNISRLKSKLKKSSKKSSKSKYTKAIALYKKYVELLETAIQLVKVEKNYNKLCMVTFPEIKDQERKIARVTGTRIKRDWLMTTELYPQSFKKKKDEGEDKEGNEGKVEKSSKSKNK